MTGFARWPAGLDIIASIVRAGFGLGVVQGIAGDLIAEGVTSNGAGAISDTRAARLLGCLRLIQPALGGLLVDPVIYL